MHKEFFPFPSDQEVKTLLKVSHGIYRVIHSQRKRKLKRKGVYCWCFPYLGAYLWEPGNV